MDQDVLDVLTRVPLFDGVSLEQFADLLAQGSVHSYRPNTVIMQKGDEANALYILLSGRVKVFRGDGNGKEFVLNQFGPGAYVGELGLIGDCPRTASVITLASSRFWVIPKGVFRALLLSQPCVALNLLRDVAGRFCKLTEEVERLALRDVYFRLACTLRMRAAEEGDRLVTDPLTQRELAALVGASREMVSRILKDLKAGGYVSLEGKRVVIHIRLPDRW